MSTEFAILCVCGRSDRTWNRESVCMRGKSLGSC